LRPSSNSCTPAGSNGADANEPDTTNLLGDGFIPVNPETGVPRIFERPTTVNPNRLTEDIKKLLKLDRAKANVLDDFTILVSEFKSLN
jgi:hypothetical protein